MIEWTTREEARKTALDLLTRKRLSGHEAGRLWMEDSMLVDRGIPGFLTEKELRSIGSLLRSQEDIEIYNSYLEIYKRTGIALKTAQTISLLIQRDILEACLRIKEETGKSSRSRIYYHLESEGNNYVLKVGDLPLEEFLQTRRADILEMIGQYLAYEDKIRSISAYTKVDFSSETKYWRAQIQMAIEIYNFYLTEPDLIKLYAIEKEETEKIILEKIKPNKQVEKELLQMIPPVLEKRKKEASDGQEA